MHTSFEKLKRKVSLLTDNPKTNAQTIDAFQDLIPLEKQRLKNNIWAPGVLVQINEGNTLPKKFPNAPAITTLTDKIKSFEVTILKAGTGAGKSTQLAQAIEATQSNKNKRIILTQPRILNTIGIAKRISQEIYNNTSKIDGVSYFTSDEQNINQDSKIEVMTEGYLLQQMLADDNYLNDVYCVILDEVHERSLDLDLLLGLLYATPSVKIVIMSATFDTIKYREYFQKPYLSKKGKASVAIFEVQGLAPTYQVNFLASDSDDYIQACANRIVDICTTNTQPYEDILVFLPGVQSINEVRDLVNKELLGSSHNSPLRNITMLNLHSGTSNDDKANITDDTRYKEYTAGAWKNKLNNTVNRRVILATNIAETGVTIQGLKYVIDSGYTNRAYYDPYSDSETLITDLINRGQALQRWGRVGRTFPGIVYPLYPREVFNEQMGDVGVLTDPTTNKTLPAVYNATSLPQIYTKRLDNFILRIIASPNKKIQNNLNNIKLIDPPSNQATMRSLDSLYLSGAISDIGKPTKLGTECSKMKFTPNQSKMILFGKYLHNAEYPLRVIAEIMQKRMSNVIPEFREFYQQEIINNYRSDFVNYWLAWYTITTKWDKQEDKEKFNKYKINVKWIEQLQEKLKKEQIIPTSVALGFDKASNTPTEDQTIEDTVMIILKCVSDAYKFNSARQLPKTPTLYSSNKNNWVVATLDGSEAFSVPKQNFMFIMPKNIVFDNIRIKKTKDGFNKYNFEMISVLL